MVKIKFISLAFSS